MAGVVGVQKLLLPLIAVAAVIGGGALYMSKAQQAAQFQQQLMASRHDVERLTSERDTLNERLEEFEAERQGMEDQLTSMRAQFSAATAELDRSRVSLQEFEDRFQRVSLERTQLQGQVATLTTEREAVHTRLAELEEERTELQRSVSRLRERLTLLDRDYQQLAQKLADAEARPNSGVNVISSSDPGQGPSPSRATADAPKDAASGPTIIAGAVELPPIIVRKDQAGMALPVRGRILEVNAPHNFLVLDKGAMDGVRVGMSFDIVRGSGQVGRVSVVRVRPQLSACDIVRSKTAGPIQVGDTAVQSGP